MEFVKVIGLYVQMCESNSECRTCPLSSRRNTARMHCKEYIRNFPLEAEAIIIKWHEDHPRKTFAQKFKEMFPDSPVGDYPNICPAMLGKTFTGPDWKAEDHCGNGCKNCWNSLVRDES